MRWAPASVLAAAMLCATGSLQAQGLDMLRGLAGGGSSSGALTSGTMGNAAGVLEFCVKNNYLQGAGVSSIKDRLLGKVGGEKPATTDTGYLSGIQGILQGSDGNQVDLNGGGLKAKLTEKACDVVLKQAQSML